MTRTSRSIPGPGRIESLRLLQSFFDSPTGFYLNLRETWGDLVRVHVGSISLVVAFDPDVLRQVLITDNAAFRKGNGLRATEVLLGKGLLTSNGAAHARDRAIAQPAFQPRNIAAFDASIVRHIDQTTASWLDSDRLNIHNEMIVTSLRIVTETMLGAHLDDDAIEEFLAATQAFNDAYPLLAGPGGSLLSKSPLPVMRRLRRGRHEVDRLVAQMIFECSDGRGSDRMDLLALLARATNTYGDHFTHDELRDHAVTLLGAGHETVAAALAWIFGILAMHPESQQRIADEVRTVFGEAAPRTAHLRELPWTRAVVQEVMRLHPSVYSTVREPLEPYEIAGHTIMPGTDIAIPISAMHRDPRHFDRPDEFRPERWLDAAKGSQRHKLAYIPFGAGPRVCIGSSYAMQEIMLIIARVAQGWNITPAGNGDLLAPRAQFTLAPRNGPMVAAAPRLNTRA